jgi:hypothetical protein
MFTRSAVFLLALGVLALAPASAGARTKAAHRIAVTMRLAIVSSTGTVPQAGSNEVQAGIVRSSLGRGAAIASFSFDGTPVARGTAQLFFARGSLISDVTSTATPQPDGSLAITGKGTVTRGTGRYRGARGRFTVTGTQEAGSMIVVLTGRGTVRY